MSLKVVSLCTYRTSPPRDWTDREFAACKFVRLLKGMPVSGWAHVPVGSGRVVRIDGDRRATAVDVFGLLAAQMLAAVTTRVWFVPIPNSGNTVRSEGLPRTRLLAETIVKHRGDAMAAAADVLRWIEPMPSAHRFAAPRYPEQLYPNLALIARVPASTAVVLLDDLVTTGGHLRAAAAFLEDAGVRVAGALCAGRADEQRVHESHRRESRCFIR